MYMLYTFLRTDKNVVEKNNDKEDDRFQENK